MIDPTLAKLKNLIALALNRDRELRTISLNAVIKFNALTVVPTSAPKEPADVKLESLSAMSILRGHYFNNIPSKSEDWSRATRAA